MRQHMTMQQIRAAKTATQARLRRLTAESIIERTGADMYAVRDRLDHVHAQSANQLAIAAVLRYAGIGFTQHIPAFPRDGGRPFVVPFVTYDHDMQRDTVILLHSERWDKGEVLEARKIEAIEAAFPGIKIITLEDEELRNDPHTAFLRLGLDLAVDAPLPFEDIKPARCYECGREVRPEEVRPLKEWAELYHIDLPAYDGPDFADWSTERLYCEDCSRKVLAQYLTDRRQLIACGALIALYEARDVLKAAGYRISGSSFDLIYDRCKSGKLEVRSKAEMVFALMLTMCSIPYNWQAEVDCPQEDGTIKRYRVDFLLPGGKWIEIQGAQMHIPSDAEEEEKRTSDILKVHPEWHRIPDLIAEEIAGGVLMGCKVQPAVWKVTEALIQAGLIRKVHIN